MAGNLTVPEPIQLGQVVPVASRGVRAWTSRYVLRVTAADVTCGLAAGLLAFEARFGSSQPRDIVYLWLALALPLLWLAALALSGAYDTRFIGVGSDEFRRVLNAGVCLTAVVAIAAYATKAGLARGYVLVALPTVTCLDLLVRYRLRKGLHRVRARGNCMRRVVVVGHADVISHLISELRRDTHHGLTVVAACVAGRARPASIGGVPVAGRLADVADVVWRCAADTVAVLACPEMIGTRLRDLAWDLEKTGTDLCVAPALLDVAGPRTTIRPVAGLPLLHVDHPDFQGLRWLIKSVFDRSVALFALLALLPFLAVIALMIKLTDPGPALFRQTRVGRNGRLFTVYKFRTMVADAESRKAELMALNEGDGLLFKIRRDPRVTRVGGWLRRYSMDELPQFINVLVGDMSLVGPRPALPAETSEYGRHVRRRLAVRPGITGLWQVSGRSDLSWDEAVRLDVRYVENWSFVLDLQILWKTWSAVTHGDGAYLPGGLTTYSCAMKSRTGEVRNGVSRQKGGLMTGTIAARDRHTPLRTRSALARPAITVSEQDDGATPPDVLVRLAAAGDKRAWERLVDQYSRLIWAMTREFKLRETDAADVVQATWLRLLEHIGRIEYPERIGSWLATTARHECLRQLAASKRVTLLDDSDAALDATMAPQPAVDERLLAEERAEAVRAAVATLPTRSQQLLELLMADPPVSYTEISDQLGLPIGSIGPTRGRCLERLRLILQPALRIADVTNRSRLRRPTARRTPPRRDKPPGLPSASPPRTTRRRLACWRGVPPG